MPSPAWCRVDGTPGSPLCQSLGMEKEQGRCLSTHVGEPCTQGGWMSRSHPDDRHQGTGETACRHRARKPSAEKTLGAGTCGATGMSPVLPRDPGRGTPALQGGFGQQSHPTHTLRNRWCWGHPLPLHSCSVPSPTQRAFLNKRRRWPTKPAPQGATDRRGILAPRCSLASRGDPGGQWGQRVLLL